MNYLNRIIENKSNLFIYSLLFLFPIFGISIRHWFSGIFVLLLLSSLFMIKNARNPLEADEKLLIWLAFIFFIVFIITSLVNGWGSQQTRYLGSEIRFLFFIPLYLMLRQFPDSGRWILYGTVLAIPIALGQTLYDLYVRELTIVVGAYSQLLVGPVIALFGIITLAAWPFLKNNRWYFYLLPFLMISAVFTVAVSGNRSAYVGSLVLFLSWAIMTFKARTALIIIISVVLGSIIIYFSSNHVARHVDNAVADVKRYLAYEDSSKATEMGSGDTRLEMIKASFLIFKDNPVFGIGRGNWSNVINDYVNDGKVSPAVGIHGHPHNMFLEQLVSKGILGFVVFVMFYVQLFRIFIARYKIEVSINKLGLLHLIGIFVFGLFAIAPVGKSNFIAIFLLYLAVFASWSVTSSLKVTNKAHLS